MPKSTKVNFAASLKELESIAEWFEREDADLEEGLKKFERGLELARDLKKRIAEVENKVKEVRGKFNVQN